MRHFRQEWIEALESGRFPQAFGKYRDGEKRCAIGVGFEVLREQRAASGEFSLFPIALSRFRLYGLLGLSPMQGVLVERMNDKGHLSHGEIARIVRQLDNAEAMIEAEHDLAVWENREPLKRSSEAFPGD
jgi:hypothetical protein